ncbi:PQQ-dependent sugar dehydrogenase [Photobacterium sp. DNB23_23_1]|uniref:PQQ-dependent sugar dehydrogenase n=1 Tax=Photobacterium pectinilyticum TaxID=2906793 RepID=A0ABT1N1V5_9GAMM|nr:PQQ-dependent sugar dehydrogenase [Photobacterium sp. ZSDE20]MCQ1057249.1 PQQ-dependent sugar dehydrogenase [Photobacterium sp. ZSDE20]MDD1821707.1 PQQ-dependent sugar dehydrogenase [Photobacterium sp. ZSDE20]
MISGHTLSATVNSVFITLLCGIGLTSAPKVISAPAVALQGSSQGMNYVVEKIAQTDGVPWGMVFTPNNQLLITYRDGTVRLLDPANGTIQDVSGQPAISQYGQGGLLDVAKLTIVNDNNAAQTWYYFTYSKAKGGEAATTLARAQLEGRRLTQWQDLLFTQSLSDASRHFGSRIAFDDEEHVFFSIGDRAHRPNGQDLSTHAGSILRLNLDGSVPKDNPFVNTANALPEIWSYGHRNPQGLQFDPLTHRLWSNEHGPRGGDEINLITAGANYGWPKISHGKEYWGPIAVGEGTEKDGIISPLKVYIPSIAPGSLLLYRGTAFPNWQGHLFSGALKLRHLNRVSVTDTGKLENEERLLEELDERIRALVLDEQGWLYFSADSGTIYRLRPHPSK